MSFLNIVRLTAIALSIIVVVAGFALLLIGPSKLAGVFGDDGDLPQVEFATLSRAGAEKSYLACPAERCPQARPDAVSPVFDIPIQRLRNRLIEFVDSAANVKTHRLDPARGQFTFLAPAPGKPAPDVVTVRLYSLSESESSLAVYSRTVVGSTDRDVHERRVRLWLAALTPMG